MTTDRYAIHHANRKESVVTSAIDEMEEIKKQHLAVIRKANLVKVKLHWGSS